MIATELFLFCMIKKYQNGCRDVIAGGVAGSGDKDGERETNNVRINNKTFQVRKYKIHITAFLCFK